MLQLGRSSADRTHLNFRTFDDPNFCAEELAKIRQNLEKNKFPVLTAHCIGSRENSTTLQINFFRTWTHVVQTFSKNGFSSLVDCEKNRPLFENKLTETNHPILYSYCSVNESKQAELTLYYSR